MSITYYKRFRMETDLFDPPRTPALPDSYFWVPWDDGILDLHAEVHHHSFSDALDCALFPSFSDPYGCVHLLKEIRKKPGFLAGATWLVACPDGCCGSVQGVVDRNGHGAIQNIGVVPGHRSLGLGTALLLQALHGFRDHGVKVAYLEVTADNSGAVRLYHRLGFRKMKTLYKAVDD
jgi:ribosomal protein S18 acetylase RimI-like enzyme